MKRHLISTADLSRDDALLILDTAEESLRYPTVDQEAADAARPHRREPLLRGLDRTRISFEAAAKRCPPTSSLLGPRDRACSKGESLKDTALTLEAMGADGVVIRHHASGPRTGWPDGSRATS